MYPLPRLIHFMGVAAIVLGGLPAGAQTDSPQPVGTGFTEGVITVSGDSVDRLRLAQLDGTAQPMGLMLRSLSSLSDPRRHGKPAQGFTLVLPYLEFAVNSNLPFGHNDGALWKGKGSNVRILAGFTGTIGPLRLVAIPEFTYSANSALPINPIDTAFAPRLPPNRSQFSSPFNVYPYTIDLPYRFGAGSVQKIFPGQSSITLTAGPVEAGLATENEWWGPAIRNPLILGDNAPGFPHAFIRSNGELSGPFGSFETRLIVGGLQESEYFDDDVSNDVRSISAIALAWRPRPRSQFTLGFTRAVIAPAEGYSGVPSAFFDFLRNAGHPNARSRGDTAFVPGPDQLFSLFGRWAIPRFGLESYVEWARADFPVSPRDFLEQPNHSRGYTAGLQWTRANASANSRFRLLGEITSVEQSSTYRLRPIGSFYTSRAVPQGFTNDGQVLGTALGPGSSGGYFAADYFRGAWQFGVNFGRTRFNNDAFFLLPHADRCGHDVTVYPGMRASFTTRVMRIGAEFVSASRYNTFFQNKSSCESGGAGSDRHNNLLSITVTTLGF